MDIVYEWDLPSIHSVFPKVSYFLLGNCVVLVGQEIQKPNWNNETCKAQNDPTTHFCYDGVSTYPKLSYIFFPLYFEF